MGGPISNATTRPPWVASAKLKAVSPKTGNMDSGTRITIITTLTIIGTNIDCIAPWWKSQHFKNLCPVLIICQVDIDLHEALVPPSQFDVVAIILITQ